MTALVEPVIPDLDPVAAAAIEELWRRGDPSFLLDETQREIWLAFKNSPSMLFAIEAARQLGKTFVLCAIALATGVLNPNCRINYVAQTGKACREMVIPNMNRLIKTMPTDVAPIWVPSTGHYEFPNGAYIVLFGCDDQASADNGRGPASILNIVDEAGFIDALQYLITSVLMQQNRRTAGRNLLSSTPPLSPGHFFCELADGALEQNAYIRKDIYSPGMQTLEEKEKYISDFAAALNMTVEAFKETSFFKREFLALRVIETDLAIVPEFMGVKKDIIQDHPRQPYFDLYLASDLGMTDKTGVLFGVSDFPNAILCIEHEILLTGANTKVIADAVKVVLDTYPRQVDPQTGKWEGIRPYQAVIDATVPFVDRDLWDYHRLSFAVADKRDSDAAINVMRLKVGGKSIRIHPRCVNLIHQLETAIRAKPGGQMIRTARDGHFDLVDCLKMLIRIWDNNKSHNPFPLGWVFDVGKTFDPKTQARVVDPPKVHNPLASVLLSGTSLAKKNNFR